MNKRASANKSAGKAAVSKRSPRKKPKAFVEKPRDEKEEERTVWMDPDALSIDCGMCFMPFEAEVFMCYNGHAACPKCCISTNRKCWCCGEPTGDVRCRPAEKMLAEMNTRCKFSKYGCAEVVKYVEKRRHEEACPRAPSVCPVDGCSYRGMGLYSHLRDDHADLVTSTAYLQAATVTLGKSAPFRVLLVAERTALAETDDDMGSVFLLLNGGGVLAGRSLSLVRLGPRPEGNKEIDYMMEVQGSEPGALSLAATAPCVRLLEGFEPKKFLFVPNADWGPSGSVSVSIRIG